MVTTPYIERILDRHEPALLDLPGHIGAAVALILSEAPDGLSILFIERAARDGDPWSGDIGFPGGKVERTDGDPRQAAERETREEIGLDLGDARYLGRLSDIAGAHMPVRVSCFVYAVTGVVLFSLSDEVRNAFWVPLPALLALEHHVTAPVLFRGESSAPSHPPPPAGESRPMGNHLPPHHAVAPDFPLSFLTAHHE